jgi:hypothetical protein
VSDKPKKNRRGKASVLSAHAEEQMEAHARTFLANLEHYGIQGVLYLKFPEAKDQVLVFTDLQTDENYITLLKDCSKISLIGARAIVDKS